MIEQTADKLQRDVFERKRRAMEQLSEPEVVSEINDRHDFISCEGCVGIVNDCGKRIVLD